MALLTLSFINAGVFSSTQETYRTTRYSYEFIHNASPSFDYPKRAFNDFHLRDYLNSTVCLTMWGSGTGIFSFTDFLGNLNRLNIFRFALHIKRKAGGYFSYTETLFTLLKSDTLIPLQSLLYSLVTP